MLKELFIAIGQGLYLTIFLLIFGLSIGLLLGVSLGVVRYSFSFLRLPVDFFVSFIRGTPLLLQLSLVYFILPQLLNIDLSQEFAGILTFGVNSSAYVAEIVRGGIASIDKGQFEAAEVLKIPKFFMWRDIILPQVLRNMLPALINETVALLKETSVISAIGGMDLTRRAKLVAAQSFSYFLPYLIAAVYYYGMVLLIEFLGRKLEQKVSVK